MPMTEQEFNSRFLNDAQFREEFKKDPTAFMRSQGMKIPEGVTYEVVESTPQKQYIVMPPMQSEELSDDDLATVSGGTICFSWSCSSDP